MKKQTAVEWLEMQLKKGIEYNPLDLSGYAKAVDKVFEKAKAMEKEQIKYAFGQGSLFGPVFPDQFHYRADDYYQYHYGQ